MSPRVRDGRKFLYTSKLSAGGKSACASCYVDGDSDQLAWNLSTPAVITTATVLPGALLQFDPETGSFLDMPNHKGPMVTQTFHGLLNFEVDSRIMYALMAG